MQLALVHDLGRLLRVDEQLPVAIIDVVAEQLGVEPGVFDLYARRDETRREHASEIVLHLKLRTIRQADYRVAITAGAAAAVGTEQGEPIVRAIIDELKVHRLGELRDRTAEAMAYRASGLNLVVNAIILWNTTYLARTLNYVRGQGVVLTDELLSHVAPVKWDHIALTGDYLWSEIERPRERFRPLRTNRFDAAICPTETSRSWRSI